MNAVWILALAYPAAIAFIFWLAFLRPVQQHQKKQREHLASLQVGDEVLTQAGFIARILEIRVPEERGLTEIILDLGGTRVRATASAIVERLNTADETGKSRSETVNIEGVQGSPNA
jgi:preprotein translocase YajC subunit